MASNQWASTSMAPITTLDALVADLRTKPRNRAYTPVVPALAAQIEAQLGSMSEFQGPRKTFSIVRCADGGGGSTAYVEYVSYEDGYETPEEFGWDGLEL